MTFQSSHIKSTTNNDVYQVVGDLTLRGVTKPVKLWVEVGGPVAHASGLPRAHFRAKTTLNRRDYGINWHEIVDPGVLVGDAVQVTVNLVALKHTPDQSK